MTNLLLAVGTGLCWCSLGIAIVAVFKARPSPALRGGAAVGLLLTICLLTYHIIGKASALGYFPAYTWPDLLVLFAWSFALVLVATLFREGRPVFLCAGLIAPALSLLLAVFLPLKQVSPQDFFYNPLMGPHVVISILGYAALCLAFFAGLFYFILERGLKGKRDGMLAVLPSLEELDRFFYRAAGLGFIFLTLGIMHGVFFLHRLTGNWWSWDAKVVLTTVTWLVYAVLIHNRAFIGWRGKRAMLLSLLGVLLILATFIGVNLLFPGHGESLLGQ